MVEPALLATALARLLRARGWQVRDGLGEASAGGEIDAMVVSAGTEPPAAPGAAPVTIVLPASPDGYPVLVHRDSRQEVLGPGTGQQSLSGILDALGAGA